jgi:hypothetical protein
LSEELSRNMLTDYPQSSFMMPLATSEGYLHFGLGQVWRTWQDIDFYERTLANLWVVPPMQPNGVAVD